MYSRNFRWKCCTSFCSHTKEVSQNLVIHLYTYTLCVTSLCIHTVCHILYAYTLCVTFPTHTHCVSHSLHIHTVCHIPYTYTLCITFLTHTHCVSHSLHINVHMTESSDNATSNNFLFTIDSTFLSGNILDAKIRRETANYSWAKAIVLGTIVTLQHTL
jgi:hypothetical protein